MTINITRDKRFRKAALASSIHGKHPYKIYLEILGNSNIGRYIVVISNKILNEKEPVNEILVQLTDKVDQYRDYIEKSNIAKPNMINQYFVRYRVREKSIIDLEDKRLLVFKPVENKKDKFSLFN